MSKNPTFPRAAKPRWLEVLSSSMMPIWSEIDSGADRIGDQANRWYYGKPLLVVAMIVGLVSGCLGLAGGSEFAAGALVGGYLFVICHRSVISAVRCGRLAHYGWLRRGSLGQQAKFKREVASVIADEHRLKSQLEGERNRVRDWEHRAMLAVSEGRDDLAKQALFRQQEHAERAATLEKSWRAQKDQTEKLRASLRQLNDKIE